jgi:hypothetical protein
MTDLLLCEMIPGLPYFGLMGAVFHEWEGWGLSVAEADRLFKFRPFYALLQDGFDRMFDTVKSEEFHFLVNGECYESTLAEAVLISPTVHDVLRNDRSFRVSVISDKEIDSRDFGHFLDFIRCHDCVSLLEGKTLLFLTICPLFRNERLALILLASQNSSQHSISVSKCTSIASSPSSETVTNDIVFCDANIDYCASHFHCYSQDSFGVWMSRHFMIFFRRHHLQLKARMIFWVS